MGTSVITHTQTDPFGVAVEYVANFRLTTAAGQQEGFRLSDGTGISAVATTTSNNLGAISVSLENNSNIVPAGSFYVAELLLPSSAGGTQEAGILSSSSVSPQSIYSALINPIPSYVPFSTVPASILAGNNIFTGINQFNGNVYFGSGYPWYDVVAFGAVGNGVADDTSAIEAAITAAGIGGGGIVYFPPGTYRVSGTYGIDFEISNPGVANVTLLGTGTGSVIQRDSSGATNTRLGSFLSCDDLRISNLAFDVNGIVAFGGLAITSSARVTVDHCYCVDSNPSGNIASDHYWLVPQLCTDVKVTDNISSDVELVEANNCDGVKILDNFVLDPPTTTGIGGFAVGNSYYFKNYEVAGNLITNPHTYGIVFKQDAGGVNNTLWYQINIHDNVVYYDGVTTTNYAAPAISFDLANTGAGNVAEDIWIEDNIVYVSAGLIYSGVGTCAPIFVSVGTPSTPYISRMRVCRNNVRTATNLTNQYGLSIRSLADSVISGNISSGGDGGLILTNLLRCDVSRNNGKARAGIGIRFQSLDTCSVFSNLANSTSTAYQYQSGTGADTLYAYNDFTGNPPTIWTSTGVNASDIFISQRGEMPTGATSPVLYAQASSTTHAGFRITPGLVPSSSVRSNGDMWTTTDGLYVQINSAPVGPLT